MFNSTINMNLASNSHAVQFNAPSTGILQRSNPKSIFVRFQSGSNFEDRIFPSDGTNPYIHKLDYFDKKYNDYKDTSHKIEVIVLQILVFGNDYFLVEVVEPKFLIEELPS